LETKQNNAEKNSAVAVKKWVAATTSRRVIQIMLLQAMSDGHCAIGLSIGNQRDDS
jgi:hypothetical protein